MPIVALIGFAAIVLIARALSRPAESSETAEEPEPADPDTFVEDDFVGPPLPEGWSGPVRETAGEAALRIAKGEIGVHEKTGKNDGLPAQRYSDGREEAWCANFVAWAFRQAGSPLPGDQRSLASVQVMEDRLKDAGLWFESGDRDPQPGDIIFFGGGHWYDFGRNRHVGIVVNVQGDRVYTVEGNASDAVQARRYKLTDDTISGYARI